jgi:quinol monooxygenase YgiN
MAFVCSATWVATPGMEDRIENALKELAPASRTEAGNIYYQAYKDPIVHGTFHIFEVYTDESAFKAHGESEHFKQFALGEAIPALAERKREYFETLDY